MSESFFKSFLIHTSLPNFGPSELQGTKNLKKLKNDRKRSKANGSNSNSNRTEAKTGRIRRQIRERRHLRTRHSLPHGKLPPSLQTPKKPKTNLIKNRQETHATQSGTKNKH